MPRYIESPLPNQAASASSFLTEFGDLLPDTIKVALPASRNGYGEDVATTATTTSYRGRVMRKSSARRDQNNVEFVSPVQCVLDCQAVVPLTARVTLPDGTSHIVRDSEIFRDENNAPHHVTLYFSGFYPVVVAASIGQVGLGPLGTTPLGGTA